MTEPGEGVDAPVGGGVSPDEGWERFHPVSPLLRGGLVLIAFVGYLLSTVVDDLLGVAVDERQLEAPSQPAPDR